MDAHAVTASFRVSCDDVKLERTALKQAPKGVRGVSKHVLEVQTAKGTQRFVDGRSDAQDPAGLRWRYCGYHAEAKAHLIEMMNEHSYSGQIVLDNGQRLLAGHTVLFSPTMQAFLAIKQESGMDGEYWTVQDAGGRTMWNGYAGTLTTVDGVDMVVSSFERPQWTAAGQLTAQAVCASSRAQGPVTLVVTNGKADWTGKLACP
jgi:hypothetical protein